MTEELLREFSKEAIEKGQLGLFIWANWPLWDELAGELREGNEYYDFSLSKLMQGEETAISIGEKNNGIVGIIAVPAEKILFSNKLLKHVLQLCEENNHEGPVTLIPSNILSKYF